MTRSLLDDRVLRRVPVIEGHKVLPPVVLQRRLGQGAMGAVFSGVHLNLGVQVAVKCLMDDAAGEAQETLRRFRNEARTAARVRSPNLVGVFDVLQRYGLNYIVMELVDGETAEHRVRREGVLTPQAACTVMRDAARGLATAHEHGVVHRDVKPANLLISWDGVVKLTDLGIAKSTHAGDSLQTMASSLMGTPAYMAPELFHGAVHAVPASDVYAMGLTLAYLLVGKHVVHGESIAHVMKKHLDGLPPFAEIHPEAPPAVAALIDRCTAMDADARFADGGELRVALDALLQELGGRVSLEAAPNETTTPTVVEFLDQKTLDRIADGVSTLSADAEETAPLPFPATRASAGGAAFPATVRASGPDTQSTLAGPPPTPESSRGGGGVVAIAGLVVVVLGLVAFLLLRGDEPPQPVTPGDGTDTATSSGAAVHAGDPPSGDPAAPPDGVDPPSTAPDVESPGPGTGVKEGDPAPTEAATSDPQVPERAADPPTDAPVEPPRRTLVDQAISDARAGDWDAVIGALEELADRPVEERDGLERLLRELKRRRREKLDTADSELLDGAPALAGVLRRLAEDGSGTAALLLAETLIWYDETDVLMSRDHRSLQRYLEQAVAGGVEIAYFYLADLHLFRPPPKRGEKRDPTAAVTAFRAALAREDSADAKARVGMWCLQAVELDRRGTTALAKFPHPGPANATRDELATWAWKLVQESTDAQSARGYMTKAKFASMGWYGGVYGAPDPEAFRAAVELSAQLGGREAITELKKRVASGGEDAAWAGPILAEIEQRAKEPK